MRAERHANTDLACPARDGIGFDAVNTNDRKPKSALDLLRPIMSLGVDLQQPSRVAEPDRPNPFDDPDYDDEP